MKKRNSKKHDEDLCYDQSTGPLGKLLLVASDKGLRAAIWNCDPDNAYVKLPPGIKRQPSHPILLQAKKQFIEYFLGKRRSFDLPLAPHGTPFQLRAWEALRRIPYGTTISYQQQAEFLGGANYARAVGAANRTNPISIIIPCHRVVGKNGELTGFLYGMNTKAFLLSLEKEGISHGKLES